MKDKGEKKKRRLSVRSIADLSQKMTVPIVLERRGRIEQYEGREVSAREIDEILRAKAQPRAPRATDAEGKRYIDWTDEKYLEESNAYAVTIAEEIIRRSLGSAFFGTEDPAEQLELLRGEFTRDERHEMVKQIRNPVEVGPDDEEAADDKFRPTGAAPSSPTE